jgi:Ca-activated chloride channel family protein
MIPDDFHFLRPLWLLALIPAAFLVWRAVRPGLRSSAWRNAVDAHLLKHLLLSDESGARRWPGWLLGLGWALATFAMAGPSWERVAQPTAKTIEPTVVVLDMSVTMDAEDLKPSRLARARFKLQDVLERSAGGQVGLVIFSDEPFVVAPLTDDGRVLGEIIPLLTSDLLPGREKRPDRAIDQAAALLEQASAPGGRILLVTDSPGDDPDATRSAAARAAAQGRDLLVLGVGTEEGAPLRDPRGGAVRGPDGKPILARLASSDLEGVAEAAGGHYARVTTDGADLDHLLARPRPAASPLAKSLSAEVETWRDAGIYLVLLAAFLAPLAFRRGLLAALVLGALLAGTGEAHASVWQDLWQTRDQQGRTAFEKGDPAVAAKLFEEPRWRAAAEYESGQFEKAIESFGALEGTKSRYNLGNALARAGKLEEALGAYKQVLGNDPGHEDARFNRDLVKQLLEQQKQQKQQEQQKNQQENQQEQGQEGSEGQQDQRSQQDHQESSSSEQASSQDEPSQGGNSPDQPRIEQAQPESSGEQGHDDQTAEGSTLASADEEQAAAQQPEAREGAAAAEEPARRPDASGEQSAGDERSTTQASSPGAGQEPEQRDTASQHARAARPDSKEKDDSLSKFVSEALESADPAQEDGESHGASAVASATEKPLSEEEQAREQMLRQVPDDPAGLLRAKIYRRYAEKRYARTGGVSPW